MLGQQLLIKALTPKRNNLKNLNLERKLLMRMMMKKRKNKRNKTLRVQRLLSSNQTLFLQLKLLKELKKELKIQVKSPHFLELTDLMKMVMKLRSKNQSLSQLKSP